jgi:hypothetical protein
MISIEEAHELNTFLDKVFKFKVDDIVQPAALGDYAEVVTGMGKTSKDGMQTWSTHLSFRDTLRYHVVERWIQQCHGGIQKHYHCRGVNAQGVIDKALYQFTEGELTIAAPFKYIDGGFDDQKIIDYINKGKPNYGEKKGEKS